jgi:hypothetical protein
LYTLRHRSLPTPRVPGHPSKVVGVVTGHHVGRVCVLYIFDPARRRYDTDGRHTADFVPREARFDDQSLVTADVGSYRPNAWGLHDMHGNAWEWTRSAYRPYPYGEGDSRHTPTAEDRIVVRGGSWRDRPKVARSGYRLSYPTWQRVYNVGFRVIIETPAPGRATKDSVLSPT